MLVFRPRIECRVGRFQELGRLFGKDRRDFGVIFHLRRLFIDFVNDVAGGHCLLLCGSGRGWRSRYFLVDIDARRVGRLDRFGKIAEMLDQCAVVGTFPIRLVDIADDRRNCFRCGTQRIETGRIETNLVVVDAPDKAIQGAGNSDTALDVGHVRAAVQRVTRPVKFIGDIKRRRMSLTGSKIVADDLKVTGSLLGKYVEENRVHFESRPLQYLLCSRHLDGKNGGIRVAFRKRMRARHQ